MDNKCLKEVKKITYLGCEISCENEDVEQKLTKCTPILGIINNDFKPNLVQNLSRIKVLKALAVQILVYGSEFWTLRKMLKND